MTIRRCFGVATITLTLLVATFAVAIDAGESLASTLLLKKANIGPGTDSSRVKGNPALPANVRINPNTFTVSGISAGAAMAIQFQYAFSRIVKGAGIVAGVPYMCAQGLVEGALDCMDMPYQIDEAILKQDIADFQATGLIDDTITSRTILSTCSAASPTPLSTREQCSRCST